VTGIAVAVHDSAGVQIARVPRRRGVHFLHEVNGDGLGEFDIHLDDQLLTEKPQLLDEGNVVRMRPTNVGAPVFGWHIEEVVPARTPAGERVDGFVTVRGGGLRTLLAGATLDPEYGLAWNSADDRGFTAASADGPWRVPADWGAPAGVLWSADPTARGGWPQDWPDPAAKWLWSTDPTASAPAGRNWFRAEFTLAAAANVGIFAAADNVLSLSLNGDVVLESPDASDPFGWKQMLRVDRALPAGTHLIEAHVDNIEWTALNPGGFICTVTTLDAQGIPLVVLRRSDTVNWLCHGYGPPEPGWPAALILKTAIEESQARDEVQLAGLTFGFTATHDSDGVAWDDVQSDRFPIGGDLLTMLGRLIELGLDVDVSPDMVVNAWKRRGTDRSETVRLLPGRDVLSNVPTKRYARLRNSALVRHNGGWVRVEDAASIAAHGRRSTSLSLGATDSDVQATQQAQAFFEETARPQITLPFGLSSESGGSQPYRDFGLGDVVSAPDADAQIAAARAMSFEATEGSDATEGSVVWNVALYPEV
jgi:hypothetical protein